MVNKNETFNKIIISCVNFYLETYSSLIDTGIVDCGKVNAIGVKANVDSFHSLIEKQLSTYNTRVQKTLEFKCILLITL